MRYSLAEKARTELEEVIRREFGVQSVHMLIGTEDGANKSMQPTANASAD